MGARVHARAREGVLRVKDTRVRDESRAARGKGSGEKDETGRGMKKRRGRAAGSIPADCASRVARDARISIARVFSPAGRRKIDRRTDR